MYKRRFIKTEHKPVLLSDRYLQKKKLEKFYFLTMKSGEVSFGIIKEKKKKIKKFYADWTG